MHYIIDGYNLIGFLHNDALKYTEKENALVLFLSHYAPPHSFKVVFDGKNLNYPYGHADKRHGVSLFFTDVEETADDYLKRQSSNTTSKAKVFVSSDRDLQRHFKREGCLFLACDAFISTLSKHRTRRPEKPKTSEHDVTYWMSRFGDSV
jgi:predicted RNA-binding protein with PIN domain